MWIFAGEYYFGPGPSHLSCMFLPVALNFQTLGEQMDLNQGRFLPNGLSGYILKPPFLCQPDITFNPENVGGGPGHKPVLLTVRVTAAENTKDLTRMDHLKQAAACLWI